MPRARKPMIPVANHPTGLPYGQAQALDAQRAGAPMSTPAPAAPAPAAGGQGSPFGPRPMPSRDPAAIQAGMQRLAASVVPLNAPTQRPGEPVTAGLDVGNGPGSEVLAPIVRPNTTADLLSALGASYNDPTFSRLADMARSWR